MSRYLLSVHSADDQPRPPMSEEQMREGFAVVGALEDEMRAAGAFVLGGRLEESRQARVVRPSGGRLRATDGPFVETKEQLGGFYIIEAPDLDAALEWGSKVSAAIHSPIEVRGFAGTTEGSI